MKTPLLICLLLLLAVISPAQQVKPCDKWLTGFIEVDPKMSDGTPIDKFVAGKFQGDASLKSKATCMVGLRISVNCLGEFNYEKQEYRNNSLLAPQCADLMQETENIMKEIKSLLPGTISGQKKDFIFKLVVMVKHNGKLKTEILY